MSTADDNRNLFKSYTTLKSVSAILKTDCSFIDPVFILATDNDVFNCNYVYCENTARFYFVRDREMLTGGRIGLHCHVDVLQSFNNAISGKTADIVRYENAGINSTPDSLLPLSPDRTDRTMYLSGAPFNLESASDLSFNFVLNVSGGSGGVTETTGGGTSGD